MPLKADCATPPLMTFVLEIMVTDMFVSELLLTAHSGAQGTLPEPFFCKMFSGVVFLMLTLVLPSQNQTLDNSEDT